MILTTIKPLLISDKIFLNFNISKSNYSMAAIYTTDPNYVSRTIKEVIIYGY